MRHKEDNINADNQNNYKEDDGNPDNQNNNSYP